MARWLIALVIMVAGQQAMALEDPTRPQGQQSAPVEAAQQRAFGLGSIVYGPGRRVAIIDGVPRREGETFDGVRLRRIHPGRIELVVNGQVQQVHLAAPPAIRTSR
ncbi:general secretion pathway protein GspB [Marinobacter bryozoorum]|uniref:general secretion pathway protein GspB n=1 Tax=Marinobacter bryozoorum TaxID=256324 RepID=UPI0020039CE7|nr:general secretion pathway protein GspB [Marinobacter bryozoorum]MCK7544279.1 general secretion pathway protein GspB [Marinobacter bryozoorum]